MKASPPTPLRKARKSLTPSPSPKGVGSSMNNEK